MEPPVKTPMEYRRWRKQQVTNKELTKAKTANAKNELNTEHQKSCDDSRKLDSFLSKFQTSSSKRVESQVEYQETNIIEKDSLLQADWSTLSSSLAHLHNKNTCHSIGNVDTNIRMDETNEKKYKTEKFVVPVDISLKRAMSIQLVVPDREQLDIFQSELEHLSMLNIFYSPPRIQEETYQVILQLVENMKQICIGFIYQSQPMVDTMAPYHGPLSTTKPPTISQNGIRNPAAKFNETSNIYSFENGNISNSKESLKIQRWQLAFHSAYQQWRTGHINIFYLLFEDFVVTFLSLHGQDSSHSSVLAIAENVPRKVAQLMEKWQLASKTIRDPLTKTDGNNTTKDVTCVFQGHTQVHSLYEMLWNEVQQWRKIYLQQEPVILADKPFLHSTVTAANVRQEISTTTTASQVNILISGDLLPLSPYKLYAQLLDSNFPQWCIRLESDTRTFKSSNLIPEQIRNQFQQMFSCVPYFSSEHCGTLEILEKNDCKYASSFH